jgi:hypothetical protein
VASETQKAISNFRISNFKWAAKAKARGNCRSLDCARDDSFRDEGKKGHWKFEVKTKANKSRRAAIHLAMEMNRLRAKVKGRGSARRPPSGWYDFEKGLSHG